MTPWGQFAASPLLPLRAKEAPQSPGECCSQDRDRDRRRGSLRECSAVFMSESVRVSLQSDLLHS